MEEGTRARIGLWLLGLFTLVAVAGYASFGRHPELLARFPDAARFYPVSFGFFAQGHVLIAGAVLIAYLIRRSGGAWIAAFAAVYTASLFSELAGTSLGVPFGEYAYSALLGWKWFNLVPLLIPLSWFAMAVPSFVLALYAFPERPLIRIFFAAYLLVAWDLALDPAMSYLAPYWMWGESGVYYGMPVINLFGWAVTAVAIMVALHLTGSVSWIRRLSWRWMAAYYALTLAMPMGMIVAAGLFWAVLATFAALAIAVAIIYRCRRLARQPHTEPAPPVAEHPASAEEVHHFFRRHSRSFSFSSRWFPRRQRRLVACLYMLCRTIDDVADRSESKSREEINEELDDLFALVQAAYHQAPTGIGWLDEVMTASREAGVPFHLVDDLFEGVRSDIGRVRIDSWEDLERYTYRVASVVGIWMCYLFGVRKHELLLHAADLGRAMQMTNILRDVGEDLKQDRVYLPAELLALHGIDVEAMATMAAEGEPSNAYRQVLLAFMDRTEELYRRTAPAIALLPSGFAHATAVAAAVYRGIHRSIERNRFDNLTRRATTTSPEKLSLAVGAIFRLWRRRIASALRDAAGLPSAVLYPAYGIATDGTMSTDGFARRPPEVLRRFPDPRQPDEHAGGRPMRPHVNVSRSTSSFPGGDQ